MRAPSRSASSSGRRRSPPTIPSRLSTTGDKPVTISGTVAKIDWQNPHIYFYVDVKDAKGGVTQWKVEGYPPNMLVRQGWKKDVTMKVGDTIKVFGWRARANPTQAAGRDVTFADGKKLNCGPPAGTGGQ